MKRAKLKKRTVRIVHLKLFPFDVVGMPYIDKNGRVQWRDLPNAVITAMRMRVEGQ